MTGTCARWTRRPPSPAITKAILVNTASDIAGGDSGKNSSIPSAPNTDEGWGRVNIGAALDATQREYLDQAAARRSTRTARASCAPTTWPTRRSRSA